MVVFFQDVQQQVEVCECIEKALSYAQEAEAEYKKITHEKQAPEELSSSVEDLKRRRAVEHAKLIRLKSQCNKSDISKYHDI